MKIVHLCLSGPYNDYWGYQDNLLPRYNVKDGHEVTVITSVFVNTLNFEGQKQVLPGEYKLKTGEKIIRLPLKYNNKLFEILRVFKGVEEHLNNEKPDLIFMHGLQFWSINEVLKYCKKNPNCKFVADNHATFDNSAQNFLSKYILHKFIWKRKIKKVLPYLNKIFMIAPACKNFAKVMYGIPEEKMEYLYLGADIEKIDFNNKDNIRRKIREKLNLSDTDFVLITGGKLSKGKNTELLLKSIKKIKNDNLKLIIFGTFSDDIKQDILKQINLDDRIHYIGWLNGKEVYDYYLASDAAIFPGTKSALWEQAICSGLPLICKKWEGMEYVDVGGNCLFLENNDESEIIKKITLLMNNINLFKKMQEVAITKGMEVFSYEKIARKAINI